MIGENVIRGQRAYSCDDCKNHTEWYRSHKAAIAAGWAISRDYKKCYCPTCAPFRRNVGHTGERRKTVQIRIDSKNGELSDRA